MYCTTNPGRVCRVCGESRATCGYGPDLCKPCANAILDAAPGNVNTGVDASQPYRIVRPVGKANAQYHGDNYDW